jgi:hypothetical protein
MASLGWTNHPKRQKKKKKKKVSVSGVARPPLIRNPKKVPGFLKWKNTHLDLAIGSDYMNSNQNSPNFDFFLKAF